MNVIRQHLRVLLCALVAGTVCWDVSADGLRNVKHGQKVPDFEMSTATGKTFASKFSRGKVLVVVYMSAEQMSSERAASDASNIAQKLDRKDLELVCVTADIVHKAYFASLWKRMEIKAPLCLDTGRKLYGKLGLIVFPTTIIIDKEGKLDHVISTRGSNYAFALDAYVRHTLGLMDDAKLAEHLKAKHYDRGSPKSIASRHRAAARLLREKGVIEGAEKELNKALKISPDNVHIKLDLADLMFEDKRPAEAEKVIDRVLKLDPRNRRAKLLKGIAYFLAKNFKEAEAILLESLVLNPDPARTHYYLGMIYEQTGKRDKAMNHYKQAIQRLLKKRRL